MKLRPPISAFTRWNLSAHRALLYLAIFLFSSFALRGDSRASFLPQLQRGQILLYEIHGRLDRNVKTESGISSSRGPQQMKAIWAATSTSPFWMSTRRSRSPTSPRKSSFNRGRDCRN